MNDSINKSLSILLQKYFVDYLINQRNLSPRTVGSYRDTFRLLLKYITKSSSQKIKSLCISDFNVSVILGFLEYLENVRNNSIRTRNVRLAAIHSFMQYVSWQDPQSLEISQAVLAIPMKRYEKPLLGYLSFKEMQSLIETTNAKSWSSQRDQVLLTTLYNTGARVSEVIALRCSHVELEDSSFIRIFGKGRKERSTPVWKSTARLLRQWISENRYVASDPLFPNRFGNALSRSGVENRVKVATKKASLTCTALIGRKVTPHTIRHTTAMHLLQAGVDLTVIAIWLGHESVSTTHHYLEADLKMKERALGFLEEPKGHQANHKKSKSSDLITFLDRL